MGMTTLRSTGRARPSAPRAPAAPIPDAAALLPPGSVTGVAVGGLGTAANLDDTQLYDLEDLQLPAPAPESQPARGQVAPPFAQPARVVQPAAPVVQGPAITTAPRPRGRPMAGGAIVAIVLVVVVG